MDSVLPLAFIVVFLMWAVGARLLWIQRERKKLVSNDPEKQAERLDPEFSEDERDKTYTGRVIRKLRVRVIEGRVEINWQFNPEYVHRGFFLTGKNRRNDGAWEPLAFEPHQDSGSWEECFNYGESRSYLFTVKKTYYFFFGILGEQGFDIVYDQISFAVRKGRYLKEKKEVFRDRREVLEEVKAYSKAASELREMFDKSRRVSGSGQGRGRASSEFAERLSKLREIDDAVEQMEAEILAHPTWSEERKREEIERVKDLADEMRLKGE